MIINEIKLYFFDWFRNYSQEHNLEYPFNNKVIYPLEKITNIWKTMNIIQSEYSPSESIKLQPLTDLEIEASPYKEIKIEDKQVEINYIKNLYSQINYSNIVLGIMTKQLTRIENSTSSNHKEIPSGSRPVKPIYRLLNVP